MSQDFALGNVTREIKIDLEAGDYVSESSTGFFLRSDSGATLIVTPMNNQDDEEITKTIDGSYRFDEPELYRKVRAEGSPIPDDIYVGYAV